jgi:hypothetical protein
VIYVVSHPDMIVAANPLMAGRPRPSVLNSFYAALTTFFYAALTTFGDFDVQIGVGS